MVALHKYNINFKAEFSSTHSGIGDSLRRQVFKKKEKKKSMKKKLFPKSESVKEKWLQLIGKSNWVLKKHNRICSQHFTPNCFQTNNDDVKGRRLKKNVLPSLNLPSYVYTKKKPHEALLYPSPMSPISNTSLTCKEHEAIISRLQLQLQKVNKVSQQRLKKINTLRKECAHLSKKAEVLYRSIRIKLKEENFESDYITVT